MLKKIIVPIVISFLFILSSCSSTSNLAKQTQQAGQAFSQGDYLTAYNLYTKYIQQKSKANKPVDGFVYSQAGKAAFLLKKDTEAEDFLKQAYYKNYADSTMYADMVSIYKKMDNLSKELDALEYFVNHFQTDSRFPAMQKRLFEAYIESENWEKAKTLWPQLNIAIQGNVSILEDYLLVQQKTDDSKGADQTAQLLLKKDKRNQAALKWMAEKYFWEAENRYQKELDAYEKNRTNKQYKQMLTALDVVTAKFKKSLGYYQTLYKYYPSKEYAKYISNIYTRFQDKKNAEYYKKLSQ